MTHFTEQMCARLIEGSYIFEDLEHRMNFVLAYLRRIFPFLSHLVDFLADLP